MCARAAGRPVFLGTTQTAGAIEVFGSAQTYVDMISTNDWGLPRRYSARPSEEPIYYGAQEVSLSSSRDYAQNNVPVLMKMPISTLKALIRKYFLDHPSYDIGYSDLMDSFPSADLEDIVAICADLEEESKIAAVKGT